MSDTKNNATTQSKSSKGVADTQHVSLVELIMILLLIGLVFVFFFGMRQLKKDKAAEAIAQAKFEAVIPTLQTAINAAEEYKKTDDFGEYPFDYSQLNIGEFQNEDFTLEYDGENYAFVLITTPAFGKEGIRVTYVLRDRSYSVADPAPERKPTIRDEWLPYD